MILVDTSIWVDYFRRGYPGLTELLERSVVAINPFVIGEIACGSLRDREAIQELLLDLPGAVVAGDAEVLHVIARHTLHGRGI